MATTPINQRKYAAFLDELTELSRKYGLQIKGCGCCESPWVEPTKAEQERYIYSVYERGGDLALRSVEDVETQEWWKRDD